MCNQWLNGWTLKWITQWILNWTNEHWNGLLNECWTERTNVEMDYWMHECSINGWMYEWMNAESLNECWTKLVNVEMSYWLHKCAINDWMDERWTERINVEIDYRMNVELNKLTLKWITECINTPSMVPRMNECWTKLLTLKLCMSAQSMVKWMNAESI